MDRAQAIRIFQRDVIDKLRSSNTATVNIGALYYSYDSAWKSAQCDSVGFNRANGIAGVCFDGVINPATAALITEVAAAVMNAKSGSLTVQP